jgi:hypothetical protein
MSEPKLRRYDISYTNNGITPELSDDGAWVRIGDAKRAIAAERERCAKLCEAEALDEPISCGDDFAYNVAVQDCAAAIRKGETP